MYTEFFGLIEKPFSLTPDPKYFFASGCHAEARDLLRYGVREREGFMCFVGGAGTGKTTLLRTVLDGFGDDVVTAIVLNPHLSEEDLLRIILVDFGIVTREEMESDAGRGQSKQALVSRLNEFLIGLSLQGRAAVLVVDEAQSLPLPVVEQIRLLSNLETSKQKLMQIVLAGQLGLRNLLATPELSQLAQRVSVRYTLQPFTPEEVGRYLEHRLRIAGSQGDIVFDSGAVHRLHGYTEGVPRLVNLLADRAMLAAYAQQTRHLDATTIDRAAGTLDLATQGAAPPVERPVHPDVPFDPRPQPSPPVPHAAPQPRPESRYRAEVAPRPQPARSSRARGFALSPQIWQAAAGIALTAATVVGGANLWRGMQRPALEASANPRAEATLEATPTPVDTAPAAAELAVPRRAFTVYLSSFRRADEHQVVDLRERLHANGYTTFLIGARVPGQGTLYRLIVGEYDDQRTARLAASELKQELGMAHAEAVAVADVAGS